MLNLAVCDLGTCMETYFQYLIRKYQQSTFIFKRKTLSIFLLEVVYIGNDKICFMFCFKP